MRQAYAEKGLLPILGGRYSKYALEFKGGKAYYIKNLEPAHSEAVITAAGVTWTAWNYPKFYCTSVIVTWKKGADAYPDAGILYKDPGTGTGEVFYLYLPGLTGTAKIDFEAPVLFENGGFSINAAYVFGVGGWFSVHLFGYSTE